MTAIAFLGAGNIAQAIMGGLVETGYQGRIVACDPVPACQERAAALGVTVATDNLAAVADADVVMLCVKPDVISVLLEEIREQAADRLMISVAAGITVASLAAGLPRGAAIVRCMPNTPALVQSGMTGMYANDAVTEAQRQTAEGILSAVGEAIWVDRETDLDIVTAVSGSGPAYFFLLMESMITAACAEGLDEPVARQLVLQTALGAARMAAASDDAPATLRMNVTSPGGTTQAALETFAARGFDSIVGEAINAARQRSVKLSTS